MLHEAGVGLALLALLAAPPEAPQPLRVLEGVTHENLTLYPIVAERWESTDRFRTLDEALASGEASVSEQAYGGDVGRLQLSYKGTQPLLLLAGEVVIGGQQDRVIVQDRIVAPGTVALALDVFCVERGRWSGGLAFAASNLMVHPSVREKASVDKQQSDVWAMVAGGSSAAELHARGDAASLGPATREAAAPPPPMLREIRAAMAVEARTESYAKAYSSARVAGPVDALAKGAARELERATAGVKGIVGVVVAYGGEVAWADRFASPELFQRYSQKLLRSYAVEALARPGGEKRPPLEAARRYLDAPASGARETIVGKTDVYTLREVRDAGHAEMELTALAPRPVAVHWLKIRRSR